MRRFMIPMLLVLISVFLKNTFAQHIQYSVRIPSEIMFTATLTAAQESATDTSKATGTFFGILSSNRGQLDYQVTYAGLTSAFTAAHFHLGAAGVNGGVIEPITATFMGNTAKGTWSSLPDSIVGKLMNGQIYINIHSTKYPGGEIRGQLYPVHGIGFSISLDSSQVGTPTNSSATGTGWAVLTDSANIPSLSYGVTVAGLSSSFTAAHFHIGAMGTSGGVVHPITFTDSSAYGTWTNVDDADLIALIRNGLYVNVHTTNYPAGEIRGQVNDVAPISFSASLDGANEVPAVTTNATGTGWFVLSDDKASLAYHITYANLQGAFTASHFHLGVEGVSGGVEEPITTYVGNTASGTWSNIPDSLVADLVKNEMYVNVHSSAHPGGEIRGQVWMNNDFAMAASLDGSQDVPPVTTGASGTAWLTVKNDTLWYQITVAGLSSKFSAAHFHFAQEGFNGGVVQPITFTDSTTASAWGNINDTTLSEILKEEFYINVHTTNFPAGEIRGQVFSLAYDDINVTAIAADNRSSLPRSFSLSQNYPNPFNPATTINYSVPGNGLVTLKVYDILGREVASLVNEQQPAGNYKVVFNAANLASGVYFYQLQAGGFTSIKKMMLIK